MLITSFRSEFRETARVLATFTAQARRAIYAQARYIQKSARNSMKSGTPSKPSRPGSPPHAVTGLLKRFLFFSWDSSSQSMVIGPAGFKKDTGAPRILEEGGDTTAHVFYGSKAGGYKFKEKRIHVAPRPYMAPAFKTSQTKLPEFWAKSVA